MKLIKSLLVFIMVFNLSVALNAKPQFMVVVARDTDMNDVSNSVCITWLSQSIRDGFKKHLPCAEVSEMSDIAVMIGFQRQQALLGTPGAGNLNDIAGGLGVEYLIITSANTMTNSILCKATCFNLRKKTAIAEGFLQAPAGDYIECSRQVADMMIKELTKYEICPYIGSIDVQVKTELTTNKTDSYPVYCNGKDGLYKLVSKSDKHSEVNWKFSKLRKNLTDGTVSYNLYEGSNIEEQNDCYKCQSGREGARMYTEEITRTAIVEGLSNESSFEGQKVADAYSQLVFMDDGTYLLKVRSASKKGSLKLKTNQHAEGTCGNLNTPQKNETLENKVDIPLNEILGPFQGEPTDKILTQKQTIDRTDPITKEKTTITFDFNLKRD